MKKEILQQDSTVYQGLAYIGIYEILLIFLLFAKVMYLIFLKIDQINYDSARVRIETLEFFCFVPQIIEMFLLIAQIFYYEGYRFTKKEEFLKIDDFKKYCIIKKKFWNHLFSMVNAMFSVFWLWYFLCYSCNFCACCLEEFGIFRNKTRRKNYFKQRNRWLQNKIYAV